MAREPDLKSIYQGLEPDEQEMARYRTTLRDRLQKRKSQPWFTLTWAVAGAVALVAVAFLGLRSTPDLSQTTMDDLQAMMASSNSDQLKAHAKKALSDENPLYRCNAMAVLCMVLPAEEGINLAGQALEQDPRSEFRAFYLEYLLDEADENHINGQKVEELMDREEDELCLKLFEDLLDIS